MVSELAIPTALSALRERIFTESSPEEIFQVLRALQRLGLSKEDLKVHVERIRAVNDVQGDDLDIEDRALIALDLIEGVSPHYSLVWDPAEVAAIHLPKSLTREDLHNAVTAALESVDLLPPRPTPTLPRDFSESYTLAAYQRLESFGGRPRKAELFRAPKSGYTTRPVALLAPIDRIVYEALADGVAANLPDYLGPQVVWPRSRANEKEKYSDFSRAPLGWDTSHVIVTDIESFYESIPHSLLTLFLSVRLRLPRSWTLALEGFLGAAMGSDLGLPQGPPGSELFATFFLSVVDDVIKGLGWDFVRYADDYLIGASSLRDGRRKLERLESLLREIGLRLNPRKTKIIKRSTYKKGVNEPSKRVQEFRERVRVLTEQRLAGSETSEDIEEILRQVGVSEEELWDLLYHETLDISEVLESINPLLSPELVETYSDYLAEMASRLPDDPPEDMESVERDLRECLIFLAGANRVISIDHIDQILNWFPKLARYVSTYLISISGQAANEVRNLVRYWVESSNDTDWVTAWICFTCEARPFLLDKQLVKLLRSTASDLGSSSLTRISAVRALAEAGQLDQTTWDSVKAVSSDAAVAEMLFGALASPGQYPPPQANGQLER